MPDILEGEDKDEKDNAIPRWFGFNVAGRGFGARTGIVVFRFEEAGIFGRESGFDDNGGWVLMRVETPNGGREDSITDLRDITWKLVLSDAVLEVNVDVDKWESDGFRDLVTDKGGFAGTLIIRVSREEATEGALRACFVVESGWS